MVSGVKSSPPYTLEQLEEASGEKARTIRSWIKEGLLPPANGMGRAAFYGQDHMDRLLFIGRLRKETGGLLPLAMMRDILDRLYASDDPAVVHRVAHGLESLKVAGLTGASGVVAESMQSYSVAPPVRSSFARPAVRSVDERWTTIQVRDDLELRLRSDEPERVAWLANLARRLRSWLQEGEH